MKWKYLFFFLSLSLCFFTSYAKENNFLSKWKIGIGIEGVDPAIALYSVYLLGTYEDKEPSIMGFGFFPLPSVSLISPDERLFITLGWYNSISWRFFKGMFVGVGENLSQLTAFTYETTGVGYNVYLWLTFSLGWMWKVSDKLYIRLAFPVYFVVHGEWCCPDGEQGAGVRVFSSSGFGEDTSIFLFPIQFGMSFIARELK